MKKTVILIALSILLLLVVAGCAQMEVGIKINADATIPRARVAITTGDVNVFSQIKKAAMNEYKKLSDEEKNYIELQSNEKEKKENEPFKIAWVWNFPDQKKAQEFTKQFLGTTAQLTKDQDQVILQASLKGKEMGDALDKMGAGVARPFLGNVTLQLKAYMPGEVISYVDGKVEKNVWTLEMNVGKIYKEKPDYDIEVISREK
ncbi:MAG: hypothetical protein WCP87_00725 [Atribacterota bacterium]|nr:hypothetical protein [Candidatus Atribacteria bacterium]